MFKRMTIGFKIVASFALLLLLIVGVDMATFIIQRNRISDVIFAELALMNNSSRVALRDIIDGMQFETTHFSSDDTVRDATQQIIKKGDQKAVEALGEHLQKNVLPLDPSIYAINIVNQSGRVIASNDPQEIGGDDLRYVQELGSEDFTYGTAQISDFMPVNNLKTPTIALAIATPLIDKITGKRLGALISFIKAESIVDALKIKNGQLAKINKRYAAMDLFLVNKNGYVIDARHIKGTQLMLHVDFATIPGCGKQKGYRNDRGIDVIGAALCMENGWMLVTEVPQAQAMQPIEDTRQNLIYLTAILVLLILMIIYMAKRKIVDPIKALANTAQQLGGGDFDIQTNIATSDELGDLGIALNEAAGKLRDSHVLLAQKIREVTKNFEKFKLAVEGTSDHVVITDMEGVILYANKAAEKTTGYLREEIVGNKPSLWGKQMPIEFYKSMWDTIKTKRGNFYGEITNKRKNGQIYITESHISPLFDEQGSPYGFVGVERDITRQKEIDKSKTEFVSIASHQLRTPLTIISWYIEMLSDPHDTTLSEKQKQYIEEIMRANKRMIELVNALLNVSRIDLGTFMVDVVPTDFSIAIEDTLKDLSLQIARKDLHVARQYDKSLSPVNADPKLLRIIFQNLLTNAIKYTPAGGSITIGLSKTQSNILISVADTGFGIPAYQQEKIFSKFFRADNAREREPDGNGLGLYIIKSLLEHSGGRIWFTSEENKGTTFFVELPLTGMRAKEGTKSLAI